MRPKGFLGRTHTITAFAQSVSDCFHTVLEQHGISKNVLVNGCKRLKISHCIGLKLALIGSFGTFRKACTTSITTGNSLQSTSVAREQSCLNMQTLIYRIPKTPLGLIVKGLYFSYDNVFFFNQVYSEVENYY